MATLFGRMYETVQTLANGLLGFMNPSREEESFALEIITDEHGEPLKELKADGVFYICGIQYTVSSKIGAGGYGRVYRAKRKPDTATFSTGSLSGHTWSSNSYKRYPDILRKCLNRDEICIKIMNVRQMPRSDLQNDRYTTSFDYRREVKLHAEAGRYCQGVLMLLAHTRHSEDHFGSVTVAKEWVETKASQTERWHIVAVELAKKGTLQKWIEAVDETGRKFMSMVDSEDRRISAFRAEFDRHVQNHFRQQGLNSFNTPAKKSYYLKAQKVKQKMLIEKKEAIQQKASEHLRQHGNSIFSASLSKQMSPSDKTKMHAALVRGMMYRLLHNLKMLHGECNILHLDIKPDNIAINDDDSAYEVCLVDFGLAQKQTIPPKRALLGTPGFVSPEREMTPKTDVFALGVTFGVMLTVSFAPAQLVKVKWDRAKKKRLAEQTEEYVKYFAKPTSLGFKAWLGDAQSSCQRLPAGHPFRPCVGPEGINDLAGDLVENMLLCDPKKRFSVDECLAHAYFDPERRQLETERSEDWKTMVKQLSGTLTPKSAALVVGVAKRFRGQKIGNLSRKKMKLDDTA
eukprot:Stramenopile-MAST_4_protein_2985